MTGPAVLEPRTEVVGRALESAIERITLHLPLIADDDDPKHVHQARVGGRRIRVLTKTFAEVLDPTWRRHARSAARSLAKTLGPLRDADVMLAQIERDIAAVDAPAPGVDDVIEHARNERAKARKRAVRRLDDLVVIERPPAPSAPIDTTELVGAVRRVFDALEEGVGTTTSDPKPKDLHAVRIATKHVRYTAEAIGPALGDNASAFVDAATALQTRLGELNDAVVLRRWLADECGSLKRKGAFAAGALGQVQSARITTLLTTWREPLEALRRSAPWGAG